jgi:hypothetical protein
VSREFHLITRERPATDGLFDALRGVSGDNGTPELDGDFEDPNTYMNISTPDLWIEIEPPGNVEAADLEGEYGGRALPEPDSRLCLWLTVANVPVGAPSNSAELIWRVFEDLAAHYDGIAIDASG